MPSPKPAPRRARRALWTLIGIATLSMGSLTSALTAHPGPLTGLRVAASGATLIISLALAARVMIALDRARRRETPQST